MSIEIKILANIILDNSNRNKTEYGIRADFFADLPADRQTPQALWHVNISNAHGSPQYISWLMIKNTGQK